MNQCHRYIVSEWLEKTRDSILCYPSAGPDTIEPINVFHKHVKEFWFFDLGYSLNQTTPELMPSGLGYELVHRSLTGAPRAKLARVRSPGGLLHRHLSPSWLRDQYRQPNGRTVDVIRRRGFGQIALNEDIKMKTIGVFIHRGDSLDGGSGVYYLANLKARYEPHGMLFQKISARLKDQALVVSDGSLTKFKWLKAFRNSELTGARIFEEHHEKEYQCHTFTWKLVGWLSRSKFGPTLVWGLTRKSIS